MPQNTRQFIIAESQTQARVAAMNRKLDFFAWNYVVSADQLKGLEGITLLVAESARKRPDFQDVLNVAQYLRDCTITYL